MFSMLDSVGVLPRIIFLTALISAVKVHAEPPQPSYKLSLADAAQKTLDIHPRLRSLQWRLKALKAGRGTAALKPAYTVRIDAENFMGSGGNSGFSSTELTVSLSSVIEMGGKLDARLRLADARLSQSTSHQYAETLNILGQTTQRFILALSQQKRLELADEGVVLYQSALQVVKKRVRLGATSEAEVLRAEAGVNEALLKKAKALADYKIAVNALVSLWKGDPEAVESLVGELTAVTDTPSFDMLYQRFLSSPHADALANKIRVNEAEVALAKSQAAANLSWQVGVRRNQDIQNTALVAGISVPLFSDTRNSGAEKSAIAKREQERLRQDAALLEIRQTLYQAWQTHKFNAQAVDHIEKNILPNLEKARRLTLEGYQRGSFSYLEWIAAREALLSTKLDLIDHAQSALVNYSIIEQLTGESFSTSSIQLNR